MPGCPDQQRRTREPNLGSLQAVDKETRYNVYILENNGLGKPPGSRGLSRQPGCPDRQRRAREPSWEAMKQ